MTEAQTGADLALQGAMKPQIIADEVTGKRFLVYPYGEGRYQTQDITVEGFQPAEPPPARIIGGVLLQTTGSLVNYTNRFKNDDSVLFADIANNKIVARLDYHGPGRPAHNDHKAHLVLPFSEEWALWTGIDGKMMSQTEFARFIEENAGDIAAPSGADLLDVVKDMHAVRKADFTASVRTAQGVQRFEYTEQTDAKGKGGVEIPTQFQLRLPVYFNDVSVNLYAMLRWKLDDGALLLGVKLARKEYVRQGAFIRIVDEVAAETSLTTVYGQS